MLSKQEGSDTLHMNGKLQRFLMTAETGQNGYLQAQALRWANGRHFIGVPDVSLLE